MSVVYETRPFMDNTYPTMDDPTAGDDGGRYGDTDLGSLGPVVSASYSHASPLVLAEPGLDLGVPAVVKEGSPLASTPTRSKAIVKPDRNPTKNARGYWECDWPNCAEDTKEFQRKCEFK